MASAVSEITCDFFAWHRNWRVLGCNPLGLHRLQWCLRSALQIKHGSQTEGYFALVHPAGRPGSSRTTWNTWHTGPEGNAQISKLPLAFPSLTSFSVRSHSALQTAWPSLPESPSCLRQPWSAWRKRVERLTEPLEAQRSFAGGTLVPRPSEPERLPRSSPCGRKPPASHPRRLPSAKLP